MAPATVFVGTQQHPVRRALLCARRALAGAPTGRWVRISRWFIAIAIAGNGAQSWQRRWATHSTAQHCARKDSLPILSGRLPAAACFPPGRSHRPPGRHTHPCTNGMSCTHTRAQCCRRRLRCGERPHPLGDFQRHLFDRRPLVRRKLGAPASRRALQPRFHCGDPLAKLHAHGMACARRQVRWAAHSYYYSIRMLGRAVTSSVPNAAQAEKDYFARVFGTRREADSTRKATPFRHG